MDMILRNDNPDFEIFDINIVPNQEPISEQNLILAIKKAIEEHVDIINLSLGYATYSQQLFRLCQETIENNIAVIAAAAHKEDIFYPAEFKNVVCVKVGVSQLEKIKTFNNSTVSISENISLPLKNKEPLSTSLAAAYFTGEIGRALNNKPFYDKFVLLKKKFGLELENSVNSSSRSAYKRCELYNILDSVKAAVVFDQCEDVTNIYNELKHPNIVAYYNYNSKNFVSFENASDTNINFNTILIINTLPHGMATAVPKDIGTHFPNKKIFYLGNFKERENNATSSSFIYKHSSWNSDSLVALKKPIIMISGYNSNFNKFEISAMLYKNFRADDIKTKVVTYNKKGILYSFDVFEYPPKVVFPDIVGAINNYMNCAEHTEDFDMWIIDVGGGSVFLNNKNRNNFGILNEAYYHATNIDVSLLCIDGFTDVPDLKRWIAKLNAFGIYNIFFIVSENSIDPTSWNEKDGIKTYRLDKKKYEDCFKKLKLEFGDILISMQDVKEGRLYKTLLRILRA